MKPLLAFLALAFGSSASAQPPVPKDVQAVIDRSHDMRADYAVFLTTEIATPARRWTEVQAEFQRGASHRIEVSMARTLNNCDSGDSIVYDVAHSRYPDDGSIRGVCGIDVSADPILSARMLEPISGPYGRADRIELTGEKFVRRYAVTPDGIIVGSDYIPRRPEIGFSMRTLKVEVRRGAQDPAMFTRASLARAFAPAADAGATSK